MATRLRTLGISLSVFLVPSKEALLFAGDPARRSELEAATYYRGRLAEACRALGIGVVDTADAWVRLVREQQLYFTGDDHWTAAGHRIAFEAWRSVRNSAP